MINLRSVSMEIKILNDEIDKARFEVQKLDHYGYEYMIIYYNGTPIYIPRYYSVTMSRYKKHRVEYLGSSPFFDVKEFLDSPYDSNSTWASDKIKKHGEIELINKAVRIIDGNGNTFSDDVYVVNDFNPMLAAVGFSTTIQFKKNKIISILYNFIYKDKDNLISGIKEIYL